MNHSESNPNGWSRCPAGEIGEATRRIRRQRRTRALVRFGGVAAAGMVLVGLLAFPFIGKAPAVDPGPLDCPVVMQMAQDYFAGKVEEPTAVRIREHLATCPNCPMLYDALRGAAATTNLGAAHLTVAACQAAHCGGCERGFDWNDFVQSWLPGLQPLIAALP